MANVASEQPMTGRPHFTKDDWSKSMFCPGTVIQPLQYTFIKEHGNFSVVLQCPFDMYGLILGSHTRQLFLAKARVWIIWLVTS